jgi:hypothetical protein
MNDNIKTGFEGYFKVECIKDGKVVDIFEDHNTIMMSARRSMAEIFLNRKNLDKNIQFANRFVIGTEGSTISEYIPKSEQSGFNKDKLHQCLYSEQPIVVVSTSNTNNLHKWDIVRYNNKYYRYTGEDKTLSITDTVIGTEDFMQVSKPYYYDVNFSLEGNTYNGTNLAIGISKDNRCGCTVSMPEDVSKDILKHQANKQHSASEVGFNSEISLFTEAGLYVNGRLFSMKTFPSKVKDDTTELKITWRIIF